MDFSRKFYYICNIRCVMTWSFVLAMPLFVAGCLGNGVLYNDKNKSLIVTKNDAILSCFDTVIGEERQVDSIVLKRGRDGLVRTVYFKTSKESKLSISEVDFRLDFIEKIKEPAKQVHANITSNKEVLDVKYQGICLKNVQEIKERLLKSYKSTLQKDFEFGYTTIGPHRDDIEITINNIDIRNFGSQGQQRLATLSLKVAELVLFEKQTGEKPILLLDDVLSELDAKRQKNLLNEIKNYQTIITTTKFGKISDEILSKKSFIFCSGLIIFLSINGFLLMKLFSIATLSLLCSI